MRFWLDKGVDGFRCDVITLLSKAPGLPDGKRDIALTGKEHYLDGPQMENLLSQLQEVLSEYDAFTVGESVFIDVPKALRYTDERKQYLDTVFAFDHVSCDNYFGVKQLVRKFNLRRLKKCISYWQNGLYCKGWNTLYWENHDQARIVGRYCSDTVLYEEGAKMLATVLMTLSGTPFVYQGQEIGTTSARMQDIFDYKDVETIRSYKLMSGIFGNKFAIKNLSYCSRDNARTPMQWSDEPNAGFTTAFNPWLKVNPRYTQINVEQQQNDENSVLNYYRKLIALRKADKAFVYGTYADLCPHNGKVLAYRRDSEYGSLVVACNFSLKPASWSLPAELQGYTLVTSNYADSNARADFVQLRPYEAVVYKKP